MLIKKMVEFYSVLLEIGAWLILLLSLVGGGFLGYILDQEIIFIFIGSIIGLIFGLILIAITIPPMAVLFSIHEELLILTKKKN